MSILWRSWIRFLLVASLVAGCNTLLPGLAAANAAMTAAQEQPCHHSGDKGGSPVICKASCLALAPVVAAVTPIPSVEPAVQISALDAMAGRTYAPEPPPPRVGRLSNDNFIDWRII